MKLSIIVLMTSCDPNVPSRLPGIAPQTPPARIAARKQSGNQKPGRSVGEDNSDPGSGKSRHVELAFGADVQQTATESDQDRKSGEDQGRGIEEC